jgi:hypothetical protein
MTLALGFLAVIARITQTMPQSPNVLGVRIACKTCSPVEIPVRPAATAATVGGGRVLHYYDLWRGGRRGRQRDQRPSDVSTWPLTTSPGL